MSKYREKAAALAAQMNLEEKVGQTLYTAPAVERLGIPSYNWWNEALLGVARAGTATVFPQAIGMAATFDEELLKQGILIRDCSNFRGLKTGYYRIAVKTRGENDRLLRALAGICADKKEREGA